MSKMTEDTLPPFPKAAHLTVLLHNLLLTFYSTKTENLGQKKRFIAFPLFFYMKTEQEHLSVLRSPEFFLHAWCVPLTAIQNSLSKRPEFFLGVHSYKNETVNRANGFAKSNFLLEPKGILVFYNEPSNPYLRLHTHPNLLHKHTTALLLLTLSGKAANKLFGDWNTTHFTFTELDPCVSHQHWAINQKRISRFH